MLSKVWCLKQRRMKLESVFVLGLISFQTGGVFTFPHLTQTGLDATYCSSVNAPVNPEWRAANP